VYPNTTQVQLPSEVHHQWQMLVADWLQHPALMACLSSTLLLLLLLHAVCLAAAELTARCLLIFTELPPNCSDPAITEW
jgi:hypothetical protein